MNNTGKRQEVKIYLRNSRILSWKCSAMTVRRDLQLKSSRIIHGCKSHIQSNWPERTFWKGWMKREAPRQPIHPEKKIIQEVINYFSLLDKTQLKILNATNSMIWLILISRQLQELFGKSLTTSIRTTLMANLHWTAIPRKSISSWHYLQMSQMMSLFLNWNSFSFSLTKEKRRMKMTSNQSV